MGVQLTPINLDKTSETEPAMSAFARGPEDGLIVVVGSLATIQRDLIIALAARPPSKTRTAPALESRPCNSNPSIDRHSPTPARPRWKWPMPGDLYGKSGYPGRIKIVGLLGGGLRGKNAPAA
jgi:hypothetical protein